MFGIDDDEILKRALRAYYRTFGAQAMIPAGGGDITMVKKVPYAVLSNIHGVLACYKVLPSGRIHRVDDVPQAIERKFGR